MGPHPLAITASTSTTATGHGNAALRDALLARQSGLRPDTFAQRATGVALATWSGEVDGLAAALPEPWVAFDCRSNRLAWLALHRDGFADAVRVAVDRHGSTRVACLIGTSTSTFEASEAAYRQGGDAETRDGLANPRLHHLHATTAFVQGVLGLAGPCMTISTACSSSAKVFAQAARLIDVGLVDAAVVGGVDTLTASTLFGFRSLGLISPDVCRPFDVCRDGINIGEAAGFALLERPDAHDAAPLFIGHGESSDAHHMSAPRPDGRGAMGAINGALRSASIDAAAVDYINLHGTATLQNDAVEARVIATLFPDRTRASSTKGWTGHTLGAAGIVDAIATLLALREGVAFGTLNSDAGDPACGPQILFEHEARPVGIALSNAFAFGGNNCVLAFARDADAWQRARTA
jgi:3-oxoacyl-[acyl-carrier-protein] synthase I